MVDESEKREMVETSEGADDRKLFTICHPRKKSLTEQNVEKVRKRLSVTEIANIHFFSSHHFRFLSTYLELTLSILSSDYLKDRFLLRYLKLHHNLPLLFDS